MGQYYKPVNIDRREWLLTHDYGNGLKLLEHSYVGAGVIDAVMQLLATTWKGRRMVWAGDYADPERDTDNNLYALMTAERKITPRMGFSGDTSPRRYLLNHDRRTFVDIETAPVDSFGVRLHPLPLLTAEGNGRGGGDFHKADPRIGLWARQRLEASHGVPAAYMQQDGHFIE
jgi:hypothetical protein